MVPSPAGSASGKLRFDIGPPDQTGWGGLTLVEIDRCIAGFTRGTAWRPDPGLTLVEIDRCIEVDVVRVDEVISSDDPIALLNVDTEGADMWALVGC